MEPTQSFQNSECVESTVSEQITATLDGCRVSTSLEEHIVFVFQKKKRVSTHHTEEHWSGNSHGAENAICVLV